MSLAAFFRDRNTGGVGNIFESSAAKRKGVLKIGPTMDVSESDPVEDRRHAVCLVGYYEEQNGRNKELWFVFRNSWGAGWGQPYRVPGRRIPLLGNTIPGGYGRMSASLLERFGGSLVAIREPLPANWQASLPA